MADEPTNSEQSSDVTVAPTLGSDVIDRAMLALRESGDVSTAVPEAVSGAMINKRYRLLECIGEGGMGVVWRAEQKFPVRRLVAIKLIKAGMDSRAVLTRFEAERQALAMMDHPNIACVFDGGTTEQGHPYFVMELVKGLPLTRYCDERKMSLGDRIDLFAQVCSAVQHAHQKGIIHRDLKPANLLVTEHDGKPVPKVIDFGLAKALGGSSVLTEHTLHTAFGAVAGTPQYMAPEQVAINALDVDTRADVYALGVILYELLTGSTPHEMQQLRQAAWDELRRVIREQDPPLPSVRITNSGTLASLAASRDIEPARLSKLVAGELDWIVMKALEKDRHRRYGSASDLAEDLQRHLDGEPVLAAPPTAAYRIKKFVRKHRGPVVVGAAALLLLSLGLAGTTWQWRSARSNAMIASANEKRAEEQRAQADSQRVEADRQRHEAEQQRHQADLQKERVEQTAYVVNLASAQAAIDGGQWPQARSTLQNCPQRLRGWEWRYLWQQAQSVSFQLSDISEHFISFNRKMLLIHNMSEYRLINTQGHRFEPFLPNAAVMSADGSQVLGTTWSDVANSWTLKHRWDANTGQLYGDIQPYDPESSDCEFVPSGKRIAIFTGKTLRLFDQEGRHPIGKTIEFPDRYEFHKWNFDGSCVAFISRGVLQLRRMSDGQELINLHGVDNGREPRFSPDGKQLGCMVSGHLNLFDSQTGHLLYQASDANGYPDITFSPDNRTLLLSGQNTIIFDTHTFTTNGQAISPGRTVSYSGDGRWVIATTHAGLIQRWDAHSGLPDGASLRFGWTWDSVDFGGTGSGIEVSKDGARYLSYSGVVAQLWDAQSGRQIGETMTHDDPITAVQFTDDPSLILTMTSARDASLWDANTGKPLGTARGVHGVLLLKRDGSIIGEINEKNGENQFRNYALIYADNFGSPQNVGHSEVVGAIELDGAAVLRASGTFPDAPHEISIQEGQAIIHRPGLDPVKLVDSDGSITAATLSADGSRAATGTERIIRIWDTASGLPLLTLNTQMPLEQLRFSDDGNRLAASVYSDQCEIFDARDYAQRQSERAERFAAIAPARQQIETLVNANRTSDQLAHDIFDKSVSPLNTLVAFEQLDGYRQGARRAFEALCDQDLSRGAVIAAIARLPAWQRPALSQQVEQFDWRIMYVNTINADDADSSAADPQRIAHAADALAASDVPAGEAAQATTNNLSNIGKAYFNAGRYQDCVSFTQRAVDRRSDSEGDEKAADTCRIAVAQYRLGKRAEARSTLRHAFVFAKFPADDTPLGQQLFQARAMIEPASTQPVDNEDIADGFNGAAWAIAMHADQSAEQYALALSLANRAVALRPSASYLNTLGTAQYRTGDFKSAIESLAEADKIDDVLEASHATDLAYTAMAQQRLGQFDGARHTLKQLKEFDQEVSGLNDWDKRIEDEAIALIEGPTSKPATQPH